MKVIKLELGSELKMGLSKVLRLRSFVLVYHLSKIDTLIIPQSKRYLEYRYSKRNFLIKRVIKNTGFV